MTATGLVVRRRAIRPPGVPGRAAGLATVIAACLFLSQHTALAQSVNAGDIVAVCAPCHGFEGIGRDVEIPNLAGQHDVYLANQLRAFRGGKRRHTDMRFIAKELTDAEIDQIAAYYSRLPPR